jgi:hypothetical protein
MDMDMDMAEDGESMEEYLERVGLTYDRCDLLDNILKCKMSIKEVMSGPVTSLRVRL